MQELADAPRGDPKLHEVRRFLAEGEFDQLENVWMDLVGSDDLTAERVEGLGGVARQLLAQGLSSRASPLLELLAPAAESAAGVTPETLLSVSELLVRAAPRNRDYLVAFVDRFRECHGPTSAERAFFEAANVAESGDPGRALERFDSLMRFQPGTVVYHESGWGLGEVLAVDPLLGQVKVDLAEKMDHRISIEAVDSILQVLSDESFRALLYRGGDELRRLATEDPVLLVEKVLEDAGNPVPQKEIKARLVPEVIEAKTWTKWWGQAKKKLRGSGFFRIADRAPYSVEQLAEELSFEDDLLRRYDTGEWNEVRLVARQVLKDGPKKFPVAHAKVGEGLVEQGRSETDVKRAVEIGALVARHESVENSQDYLLQILTRFSSDDIVAGIADLPAGEDLEGVLTAVRHAREDDWLGIVQASFTGRTDSLRKAACKVLEKEEPEVARGMVMEITASPRRSPDTYCWLLEQRLKEEGLSRPCLESLAQRTPRGLLVLMIDLLEHLVDKEVRDGRNAVKDLYRRLEDLMYFKKGEFFAEACALMDLTQRVQVHQCLVRNQDNLQKVATRLLDILGRIEPIIGRELEIPQWKDEKVILTTVIGRDRKQEELRVLQDEKLPAIFKAIGDAAELGDLSENAEFTSAIEERDNLVRKAEQVQDDLQKVVIIEANMAKADEVGVGSRIRVKNLDSSEENTYSILGPWDGSPEEGVLNYRSPLGQFFLGQNAGAEVRVELPGGSTPYRILEIGSHFE